MNLDWPGVTQETPVASSRTGTATYLRNRRRVLTQARADGLTHCPGYDGHPCGRELNWDTAQEPNSVEADHILEHRYGGTDDVDNLRALCRECNITRNTRVPPPIPDAGSFPTSRDW